MTQNLQYLDDLWFARTEPDGVADLAPLYSRCDEAACQPTAIPALVADLFPKADTPIWYYRTFTPDLTADDMHRVHLCFDQVICLCEVWVNGRFAGRHMHSEEKFSFDVTDLIVPGENLIACRVYGPVTGKVGPEGIAMNTVPNFAQVYSYYTVIPKTGIYGHVSLAKKPLVSAEDLYVNPDPETKTVALELTLKNLLPDAQTARIEYDIFDRGAFVRTESASLPLESGAEDMLRTVIPMDKIQLWSPDSPYLYDLHVRIITACGTQRLHKRFGFKSFRVENGWFVLNGKRIWLSCAHAMATKEAAVHAKAMGFKALRYLSAMPSEELLDYCDEIGLMVYEESAVSWGMSDYPAMPEQMASYLNNMIRRDRSHVCVGVWGIFNEQPGPNKDRMHPNIPETSQVFDVAVAHLPEMRKLDNTRLILLSSGRWDARADIGSFSNPGSSEWEYGWGGEAPDATTHAPGTGNPNIDPYITLVGDNHLYPSVPITNATRDFVRNIGKDTNPVFLSEYGVGYQLALHDQLQTLREGNHPDHPMIPYYEIQLKWLDTFIERYHMQHVYPTPRDFLMASIRVGGEQRAESIDPIRANPQLCGYSLTSFGVSNEGVYFRDGSFIPGIVDALRDSFAPLKWSVFMDHSQLYAGKPFEIETVLCNTDVLPAGEYSAVVSLCGDGGVVYREEKTFSYPEGKPLAASVLTLTVPGLEPGEYVFRIHLNDQQQPTCGEKRFRVLDMNLPALSKKLFAVGDLGAARDFLTGCGAEFVASAEEADLVCVGALPEDQNDQKILDLAWNGGRVLVLDDRFWDSANTSAQKFMQSIDYSGDGENSVFGKRIYVRNWLYHLDNYVADGRVFEGLTHPGLLDMNAFRRVYPDHYMIDTGSTSRTFCAAYGSGLFARDNCIAALTLGEFAFGKGAVTVSTFRLLENIGSDPVADRLLYNLIREC